MVAEENYKALRAELDKRLTADKRLLAIAEKISAGKADFSDTSRYSQIVSRIMGEVISQHIGEITVPLGKQMVCKELLKDHYKAINDILGEVQASVDDKLGIHLNPVKAPFPTERVDKAAHSLEDPTVPEETIKRRARSTTENIANSMHDDYIKENAKTRTQAGLKCYLVRDAGGGCCSWCQGLEGRYDYATAPDDIFRRHDNCTCTVTYECGRQRQDVWSKKTWEATPEELKARKEAEAASKPVVNSKEQAKELEAEIIGSKANDTVDELSESVLKQITEWEKENFSNSSEKGLLIMPDGTTKEFGGVEHSVSGKKEDIELMNGAIFTHNHPTDNTFSSTDIVTGLVKGNLKEMRAVTITGDVHILVNNGATEVERRKFSADFQQRVMKARGVADKKIRRGERINKDEYIKEQLEKFMQEHANEYNLSYTKTNLNELSIDIDAKSGIMKVEGLTKINEKHQVINPMDKSRYLQMKASLEKKGCSVISAKGDDERYLIAFNSEAVTDEKGIMHLGEVPSASAFFEETIHYTQIQKYGVLDTTDFLERDAREVAANRKLLRNGKAYGFTKEDFEDIKNNLAFWENDFKRRAGVSYDESNIHREI